jgi:hypothetical protein
MPMATKSAATSEATTGRGVMRGSTADKQATIVPAAAYEVRLSENGKLVWIERSGGREVVHDSEPGAGFWRRAWVGFLSILPIEKYL